jgi:DNA-3-methyladenine glycosylase II
MAQTTFSMRALPPFRLDLTVWALRRRPDNAVDAWDGRTYRRALEIEGKTIELAAVQAGSSLAPRLTVTLTGAQLDAGTEDAARAALARLLGPELDLSDFYRLAERDPLLRTMATRFRGLKPPRFPTLFECIVNAIACQQLTLTVGIRLLNRLAEAHGTTPAEGGPQALPVPSRLAGLTPELLMPLGFSRAKGRSIVELAAAISGGTFEPAAIETLDDGQALQTLLRLRGVGRWTAEYALLRGLGRLHVFPGDDVGARNNLARWLDCRGPLDYARVQAAVLHWQPFAGFVYFHLLLANLAEHGTLTESTSNGRSHAGDQAGASPDTDDSTLAQASAGPAGLLGSGVPGQAPK